MGYHRQCTATVGCRGHLPCSTHFFFGKADPGNILEIDDTGAEVLHPSRRWKYVQTLIQHFWTRWQKELLHTYRTRTKWHQDQPNLQEGSLVITLDPVTARKSGWQLGRVTKVYPGRDHHVRVVDVRVQGKIYRRPVNKLCLLEG